MTDTVTGFTAARMQLIEDQAVVGAAVVGDDLIMTRHNATTFNAGSVRGAVGPQNPDGNPAGTIIMGGWGTAPVGYLFMGQTITNGATLYPDVASIYPSWVSGAHLIIPNADGSVPMQGSPTGVVSGSMTHTLSAAQLPAHTHSGPSHTHSGAPHSHTFSGTTSQVSTDHSHAFTTGGQSASHTHGGNGNGFVFWDTGYNTGQSATTPVGPNSPWALSWQPQSGGASNDHSHSGQTGGISANHTHTYSGTTSGASAGTTGPSGTGETGNGPGTAAPINHTPKNLTVRYAVKT